MKAKTEINTILEVKLQEAYKGYELWKNRDSMEAMKYRVMANTYEDLIEEICPLDESVEINSTHQALKSESEANIGQNKRINTFLKVFTIIIFITSWWRIDILIYDLVDKIPSLTGILSALLHYGYLLFHAICCLFLAINLNLFKP